ncbi:MAG: Hsp20/alpha crystallin family protein [Pyrinomonadaceae bacterium]
MAKSTNRVFQFVGTAKAVGSGQVWYPAADVYLAPDGWVVKVELAGVSAEDIEIEVKGNALCIAGSRKDRSCSVGMSFQQMEISYSNFEKTLKFPSPLAGVTIEHNFEDGLLIINLRKG